MRCALLALGLIALIPATARTALDLGKQGGALGTPLRLTLQGDPGEVYLVIPSLTSGPTPLALVDPADPRRLEIGLELLYLAGVGLLDSSGKAAYPLALPTDPVYHGLSLRWQALTVPGKTRLVDDLSPAIVTRLGVRNAASALPAAMPFSTGLPGIAALPGGKVLVCGGVQGSLSSGSALKSSALFDSRTYTWTPGPDMGTERAAAVSVRLQDGRVLVAGGMDSAQTVLSSAELYDPATNRWQPTGGMAKARVGHMGCLLSDGRVLVSGGVPTVTDPLQAILGAHKSSEIYDPATGTWSNGGDMSAARIAHSLTATGARALAVGGVSVRIILFIPVPEVADTAEYWSGGKWTSAGKISGKRAAQGAVALPDGKVLVCGGLDTTDLLDPSAFFPLATAGLYNPATNTWSSVPGGMGAARALPGLALKPDGSVLVLGGAQGSYANPIALSTCELYSGGLFGPSPYRLAQTRAAAGIVLLPEGSFLLAGGAGGAANTTLASCELVFP